MISNRFWRSSKDTMRNTLFQIETPIQFEEKIGKTLEICDEHNNEKNMRCLLPENQ